ncbi:MAG: tetratricopeptide repeat protein [Planctomycetales bacterium]|nr:tetratricopeptide repeat protein [Planctomycetales bacterium]
MSEVPAFAPNSPIGNRLSTINLPLHGHRLSFTGTLASMTHRTAMDLVEKHGGSASEHVSKQTTMLVVGEEGWPLEPDGQPSVKLQQVTKWIQDGLGIQIINESEWLSILGERVADEHASQVHRHYTPAMLSQVLSVSVHLIRRWERSGLIVPVRRIYRLPYFDFQEVASARRLSQLVTDGVSVHEIKSSLDRLRHVLPNVDRPLAQLDILAAGHDTLVYRDDAGRLKTTGGQMLLDFEPPPEPDDDDVDSPPKLTAGRQVQTHWTADQWFAEGCRLADAGEPTAAVEAFRLCLMDQPSNAEAHFHLAEALYRLDHLRGALERYHIAVELDHQYLEAWTQLGCVHAQLGEWEPALEAFNIALDIHPDYPDARLHKAEALHHLGRTGEAHEHWRAYLAYDQRGPWADLARQRLQEEIDSQP